MNAMNRGLAGLLLSTLVAPCLAHHGVAPHYDADRPVTLDGTVAKFDFINPHSFVYIATVDDAGKEQIWQCELASRSVLTRNGLTVDLFEVGARVKLEGIAGRTNPTGCAFRVAYFPDGSILRSTTLFAPTLATRADIPPEPSTIFGTWAMKQFAVSRYEGALTPAGERARAAFDPIKDDPAIYCDPASPVRAWLSVNEPFTIRREPDAVVIDFRFMDSRRVVHLNGAPPGPDVARSSMGYSTGHFEGDALLISTGHFTAATLEPRYGVMHTEDLKLSERLAVNGAGELEITWVIDDPAYFTEPHTQRELFVRSPPDPEPYDCKPGYQQ